MRAFESCAPTEAATSLLDDDGYGGGPTVAAQDTRSTLLQRVRSPAVGLHSRLVYAGEGVLLQLHLGLGTGPVRGFTDEAITFATALATSDAGGK